MTAPRPGRAAPRLPRPTRPRNDPARRPVGPCGQPASRVPADTASFWRPPMAIEVRIPTILRSYTDGAKSVQGQGDTLGDVLDDLESRHGGLRGRLVDDSGLRKFVNVYLNDEDVR